MIRKAAMIAVGRSRRIAHPLSLHLRRHGQSQQMTFVSEPDFGAGRVDPDVVAAQFQFGKFEQGSEDKNFRVVSPESRRSFLSIVNGYPEQIRRSGRLRRPGMSRSQRAEFSLHWLDRSGLGI